MTETVSGNPTETPNTNPSDTPAPATTDPATTLLAGITDENGRQKYADVETALKALKTSQEYIPNLQTEIQDLKQRMELNNEVKTVSDLLNSTTQEPQATPEAAPATTEAKPEGTGPEMQEMFEAFMAERESRNQAATNVQSVKDQLATQYGEKQAEVYEGKAQELGVSVEFLNDMAAKSPKAVLEYFKKPTGSPTVAPGNSANVSGVAPQPEPIKNVMYGASTQEVKDVWNACKTL